MLPAPIENTDQRVDALKAALATALTGRQVARGFTPYSERDETELRAGVLNMITAGEGEYATGRGMSAKEGTTAVHLIGHLRVAETDTTETLEKAELAFIEEIKNFVRQTLPGISVRLDRWEKSRLTEHPYGWFVAFVELGPPRANTN